MRVERERPSAARCARGSSANRPLVRAGVVSSGAMSLPHPGTSLGGLPGLGLLLALVLLCLAPPAVAHAADSPVGYWTTIDDDGKTPSSIIQIFPRGKKLRPPLDSRNRECAHIALEPGAARDRLTAGMYVPKGEDATAVLEAAFAAAVACEPIERKLREAQKKGISDPNFVLSPAELGQWQRKEALRKEVIRVDDFPQDFGRAELVLAHDRTPEAKAA